MAGTAVSGVRTEHELTVTEKLREEHNKVIDDLEKLRAAVDAVLDILDADAGVTATNLASTADLATAAEMTAAKVNHR